MAHKTFKTSAREDTPEPTTFTLEGLTETSKEPWKEDFTCLRTPPSGVLDDLTSASMIDNSGRRVFNATSLVAFFEGVLIEEDVIRFRLLVHDKDRIVDLDTLGETMMWLSEELIERPTKR